MKARRPHPETFPEWEVLTYRFPGTKYTAGDEIKMTWWDGGKRPTVAGSHLASADQLPAQGAMLIGEEGTLVCAHGGGPKLYPQEKFAEVDLPLRSGVDHYGQWADGVRSGKAPGSSFAYAGPLTETVLLGVIASRVGPGELLWDAEKMKFTNSEAADAFVTEPYRKAWEVAGL